MNKTDCSEITSFVNDCCILYKISLLTIKKLVYYNMKNNFTSEIFIECISEIESITNLYEQMVKSNVKIASFIASNVYNMHNYQYETWKQRIYCQYSSLLHISRKIICKFLEVYTKDSLETGIKLINFFNKLVSLNISLKVDIRFVHNSSMILENRKKFTINGVLKIVARNKTEDCAYGLIKLLLKMYYEMEKIHSFSSSNTNAESNSSENAEDDIQLESDNTSILVYKTLTQYASTTENSFVSFHSESMKVTLHSLMQGPEIANFILAEDQQLIILFLALTSEPSDLLHENDIKYSKKNGCIEIRTKTKIKLIEKYEQALWQNVGIISEHMLLWWIDNSLGKKNQLVSQKFNSWLKQYYATDNVHVVIQPTIQSLIDCLCCYITSTSWDKLFSQALISANYQHSRHELHDIGLGTKTGYSFSDMLYDIVFLINSCEGSNWTIQDLENFPIVEQIPILHRLDHSIHTVRLWAIGRAKYLANCWNMEQFFRVTHIDINASLYALNHLQLTQNIKLTEQKKNAHFTVCSKMRTKLISEVQINNEKLQNVPNQSLSILASVCKITSLAYLKICFPVYNYWQKQCYNQPRIPSEYVVKYLDEILKPVLMTSQTLPLCVQKSVSKLVLEILCEAWLDHIYKFRIKFSEWGAVQLLTDFSTVPIWIQEKIMISDDIRQFLQTDEILRRCEGVGRLLLRQPGDTIIIANKDNSTLDENDSKNFENNSEILMPPEMYVPNQEKWLELRLNQQRSSLTICCPH